MLAHKILHNFFDNLSASSDCLEYGVTITIIFSFTNQLLSPVQVCEIGCVHRFILSTKTLPLSTSSPEKSWVSSFYLKRKHCFAYKSMHIGILHIQGREKRKCNKCILLFSLICSLLKAFTIVWFHMLITVSLFFSLQKLGTHCPLDWGPNKSAS